MPRNIIICCDGTNNQFGLCNTNVVRIADLVERDATRQLCYYDPGVGTIPEQGYVTTIGKRFSEVVALAFATDMDDKVTTAYAHLMETWEPGDRVFLFGFSRGAYTARVLAAVLHTVGLLPKGNAQLLPYVMRLFKSLRQNTSARYWEVIDGFRRTFAREIPGRADARFPIHFVGLWDTVSSVGWVWNKPAYPFTAKLPNAAVVRHAASIDERRWFFRANRVKPQPGQDAKERWFAGVHSDVGGGYPEADGSLWRLPFEWLLGEAMAAGLLVDPARLAAVRARTPASLSPWTAPQHESLRGIWWLAEVVPKRVYDRNTKRTSFAIGLGRHRELDAGDMFDGSVLKRIREVPGYAPPNISPAFVSAVRAMTDVPDQLPYSPDGSTVAAVAPPPSATLARPRGVRSSGEW